PAVGSATPASHSGRRARSVSRRNRSALVLAASRAWRCCRTAATPNEAAAASAASTAITVPARRSLGDYPTLLSSGPETGPRDLRPAQAVLPVRLRGAS